MMHKTLSALLVSLASRYAQLSPSDVGFGISGGRLVVDDVQLRTDTFNAANLPLYVHSGRAGRLRINVPWSALSSAPVEVYLENVHLIASPRTRTPAPPPAVPSKQSAEQQEWHQTNVGQLVFNISVEVYGLKLEYRDHNCVSILSVASLTATSAGRDWNSKFVSLFADVQYPNAASSAVIMRKLIRMAGVHFVMIPRAKNAPTLQDELKEAENDGQLPSQRYTDTYLDLKSYESRVAVLDGIGIVLRLLVSTGVSVVDGEKKSGHHVEIALDLDEPNINMTARQFQWIDEILKHAFGAAPSSPVFAERHANGTKRRPRSLPPDMEYQKHFEQPNRPPPRLETPPQLHQHQPSCLSANSQDDMNSDEWKERNQQQFDRHGYPLNPLSNYYISDYFDNAEQYAENESLHDTVEEYSDYAETPEGYESPDETYTRNGISTPQTGPLQSFWNAIVGENTDDTIDDAAVALGLSTHSSDDDEPSSGRDLEKDDEEDYEYARQTVDAAARAGGFSLQVRFKTPDLSAAEEIERLQEQISEEVEKRQSLQNAEHTLLQYKAMMEEMKETTRLLRGRNHTLRKELEDLERMTSQSGKNKDAVIRQLEAALKKAERNLQTLLQEKHTSQSKSPNVRQATVRNISAADPPSPPPKEQKEVVPLPPPSPQPVSPKHVVAPPRVDSKLTRERPEQAQALNTTLPPQPDQTPLQPTQPSQPAEAQRMPHDRIAHVPIAPDEKQNAESGPAISKSDPTPAARPADPQLLEMSTSSGELITSRKHLEESMSSDGLTLV